MDKATFEYVSAKVDEIEGAFSASKATKAACAEWRAAVASEGADADAATTKLADEISAHQTTIDDNIRFMQSDIAAQIYGEETAAQRLTQEQARKAAGARFCDCVACRPCHELLAKLGREEADVYL